MRLHPHFTERAFAQSTALAPIGLLAGSHHERLDGSGYHHGLRGSALDMPARILAAASVVIFTLVMLRLTGLARAQGLNASRELALRSFSERISM